MFKSITSRSCDTFPQFVIQMEMWQQQMWNICLHYYVVYDILNPSISSLWFFYAFGSPLWNMVLPTTEICLFIHWNVLQGYRQFAVVMTQGIYIRWRKSSYTCFFYSFAEVLTVRPPVKAWKLLCLFFGNRYTVHNIS